ncbi:MAG: prepilin-type N-terminal cleavage/methylation domain-containing protein [Pseudomonadales bacterium]|nr:prepilin-type N-terminal cleavage/methylation domain-containing protein [Pseudomonadales bacterium]
MNDRGFTLIELSIVLVIIGLIVGGILVGRELVTVAENRATISQVEKFSTAVNAFRNKYGALPGDMPPPKALRLGFFAVTGPTGGTFGVQDGNGRIYPNSTVEVVGFWRHLSDAQMIDGSYGTAVSGVPLNPTDGSIPSSLSFTQIGPVAPAAKSGSGAYVLPYEHPQIANSFLLGRVQIDTLGGVSDVFGGHSAVNAFSLDLKLDDGRPYSGSVRADTTGGLCIAAGNEYATDSSANGDVIDCYLMFRGGF